MLMCYWNAKIINKTTELQLAMTEEKHYIKTGMQELNYKLSRMLHYVSLNFQEPFYCCKNVALYYMPWHIMLA